MKTRAELILVLVNGLLAAFMLVVYAIWWAPPRTPRLATLDVAELYRLKEFQVASVLMKRDANETERAESLKNAENFGVDLSHQLESLSQECACLILVQAAVASPSSALPDLTPELRRKLGL